MNIDGLYAESREFVKNIQDAKILKLKDSDVLKLLNSGVIPVFENGAILAPSTSKRLASGKDYSAERPYFVCYNKELGCRVLYPMTASQTKDIIREKERYQFIETPDSLYGFIESVVPNKKFHKETHTDDSISTINISRGLPIFGEVLDSDNLYTKIDYSSNQFFPASGIDESLRFLNDFYGGKYQSALAEDVKSGKVKSYAIARKESFGKTQYTHQFYRPSVIYCAMFLNWANAVGQGKAKCDVDNLHRLSRLNIFITNVYMRYLQHANEVENFKSKHKKEYTYYTEERTFALSNYGTKKYVDGILENLGRYNIDAGVLEELTTLMNNDQRMGAELSFISGVIQHFVKEVSNKINLSDVPVDANLFKEYQALAKDKKGSEKMTVRLREFNSVIDKMISDENTARINSMIERKRELERRREENLRRANTTLTKQERLKANIQTAIKLYKSIYKDIIKTASDGNLYSDNVTTIAGDFIKIFSTYDKDESQLYEYIQEAKGTANQTRLAESILSMSQFVPLVQMSLDAINSSDNARALANYLSGKTKSIEGVNETTANSLELLKLVHSEFSRGVNEGKKASSAKEREAEIIERIIQKATRSKDKFADVDLSPESVARTEYLDDALSVAESETRILEIAGIYKLRHIALKSMKEARIASVALRMTENAVYEGFTPKCQEYLGRFFNHQKSVDEEVEEFERAILGILNDRKLDVIQSSEAIQEYSDKFIEEHSEVQEMLVAINNDFEYIQTTLIDSDIKYKGLVESIPEVAKKKKSEIGVDESFGVFDGRGVLGQRKTENWTADGQRLDPEICETSTISDLDLFESLFNHGSVQAYSYVSSVYDNFKKADNIKDLHHRISRLKEQVSSAEENLVADFDYIANLYGELLSVWKDISSYADAVHKVEHDYYTRFNPTLKASGGQMLAKDAIVRLKNLGIKTSAYECKWNHEYFDKYLKITAQNVLDYVTQSGKREDPSLPISKKFTIDSIASAIESVQRRDLEDDSMTKDDRVNNFMGVHHHVSHICEELREVMKDGIPLRTRLESEDYLNSIASIMLPLLYEIDFECMLSSRDQGTLSKSADSKINLIILLGEMKECIDIVSAVLKKGVHIPSDSYDYLVSAIERARKYRESETIKDIALEGNGVQSSAPRYYDFLYKSWLTRLHELEKVRVQDGYYVTLEGRDIEKEKALIGDSSKKVIVRHLDESLKGEDE